MPSLNGLSIVLSTISIILISLTILLFSYAANIHTNTTSNYFRFGPQDDFILISININNWGIYSMVLLYIFFIEFMDILLKKLWDPILIFNMYNPDTKITNDQHIYHNIVFFIRNLLFIFHILVLITQFDIALYSVLISQISNILTIRFIHKKKIRALRTVDDIIIENQLFDTQNLPGLDNNNTILTQNQPLFNNLIENDINI